MHQCKFELGQLEDNPKECLAVRQCERGSEKAELITEVFSHLCLLSAHCPLQALCRSQTVREHSTGSIDAELKNQARHNWINSCTCLGLPFQICLGWEDLQLAPGDFETDTRLGFPLASPLSYEGLNNIQLNVDEVWVNITFQAEGFDMSTLDCQQSRTLPLSAYLCWLVMAISRTC